ncbi:hypothetical protein SKAU_G00194680 [Synaphobranchus kaupii]|uniref:Reverse transcriptase/retrotransposon-derived protein RNase H-like domain-containing protein n=1 Tax=Synaphobranchus kaupii TaxID=118154 RepID=A0A9Q1FEB7_SYNKA|nr:hypothetical protein SKAU_G00194680 [Synaphobranchus kaupii]
MTEAALEEDNAVELVELFTVYTAQKGKDGVYVTLQLAGKPVCMQLDKGASVSLVPEGIYREKLMDCPLQPAAIRLSSYTGDIIPVLGQIEVEVKYEGKEWMLPLVIVKGEKTALLGRNWLQQIKLNWGEIFNLQQDKQLLQADTKWTWSPQCEQAFTICKHRLLQSKWLMHYDPEKKMRLACDASPYGVGAVISHVLPSETDPEMNTDSLDLAGLDETEPQRSPQPHHMPRLSGSTRFASGIHLKGLIFEWS